VLHGLNQLAGKPLDRQQVFQLCAELEGHPDNAAPGAFGGFCIAPKRGPLQRYPVGEELAFVLLIPEMELETSKARGVLPAKIPLADAALSTGNAAAIAGAFASGDYRKLAGCFEDRLHQPYRAKLMPYLDNVITAGCEAGALGGWLSGAGSTVACATLRRPDRVANAMISACGLESACAVVVRADNSGVKICMRRWIEGLESFAMDVILDRRYGRRAGALRAILAVLSKIYLALVQARLALYRARIFEAIRTDAWLSAWETSLLEEREKLLSWKCWLARSKRAGGAWRS
jgi:hypothetical protein